MSMQVAFDHRTDPLEDAGVFLDGALEALEGHVAQNRLAAVDETMAGICLGLFELRARTTPERWKALARSAGNHPLGRLVRQDPFTHRAFEKPRGYAGDALLMDFIYGEGAILEPLRRTTRLGRAIHRFTTRSPASRGVRSRMRTLARTIDRAAARIVKPHILSLACGHLREVSVSKAVCAGRVGRFVALDQDEASLADVRERTASLGVEATVGTVRSILFDKQLEGQTFDLIYSAGLYDYLDKRVALRLTAKLATALHPGGRLVIANFVPGVPDVGYMEALMDWWLVYRDAADMAELAEALPVEDVGTYRTYVEPESHVVFLEIERAGRQKRTA